MRWTAIAAIWATTIVSSPAAQDFSPIGTFQNVRESDTEEPHCYGWSLELWQHNGQVLGLIDHHQGLCGDPPCEALTDVSYDRKSGNLRFSAFDRRFIGTLARRAAAGQLGTERIRLTRMNDRMDAASDKSFENWCNFWRTVTRCKGVADVCRLQR